MTSPLVLRILDELEARGGEIIGIWHLTHDVLGCDNRTRVRRHLNELESIGMIELSPLGPGRGHKTGIRRNRNSPGCPRKVRP